jgi:hypothetical protein
VSAAGCLCDYTNPRSSSGVSRLKRVNGFRGTAQTRSTPRPDGLARREPARFSYGEGSGRLFGRGSLAKTSRKRYLEWLDSSREWEEDHRRTR